MIKIKFIFLALTVAILFSCEKEVITPSNDAQVLSDDINSDKVLKNIHTNPELDDYIVTKSDLNVNAMLTIEPGVRIAFEANTSLRFPYTGKGVIIANGTDLLPIEFTGKSKTPGFWKGVLVNTADTRNSFQFCNFSFAGGGSLLSSGSPATNLLIAKTAAITGKVNINNCKFSQSKGLGLVVTTGAKLLSFKNNTFISNLLSPMQIPPSEVSQIDNSSSFSSGNTYNGVEILGGDLQELTDVTWNNLSEASTYKILGDINVLSGLKIEAGAKFDMSSNTLLRVKFPTGYLSAIGKEDSYIVFKGLVNNKGFWKGILFTSADIRNNLSYCTVSNGGGGQLITGLENANVGVFTQSGNIGNLTLSKCILENSAGCGLSFDNKSKVVQTQNSYLENVGNNICN